MSTVEIELDDDLLALVDERAAASGKAREEVIAQAVRQQLEGGRLRDILEAARERSDLPEDDAMRLAIEERRSYRTERSPRRLGASTPKLVSRRELVDSRLGRPEQAEVVEIDPSLVAPLACDLGQQIELTQIAQ
jgi:hypothetical protein